MRGKFELPTPVIEALVRNVGICREQISNLSNLEPDFDTDGASAEVDGAVRKYLIESGCPPGEIEKWLGTIKTTAKHRRSVAQMEPEGRA